MKRTDVGKVNFNQKGRALQLIRSGDNRATLAIIGFPATRWYFILVVSYESQGVAVAIAQEGQDTVTSSADSEKGGQRNSHCAKGASCMVLWLLSHP